MNDEVTIVYYPGDKMIPEDKAKKTYKIGTAIPIWTRLDPGTYAQVKKCNPRTQLADDRDKEMQDAKDSCARAYGDLPNGLKLQFEAESEEFSLFRLT